MAGAQRFDFSFNDGARAVELARDAIKAFVLYGQREQPGSMREAFYSRTGAFVRIEGAGGRRGLRGCAGTVDGSDQLGHAIVDAAIAAASEDSCGSEVEAAELPNVCVSVCIVREVVPTEDPLADLRLGVHGAVVEAGDRKAWMYPTLPVEHGWSVPEYLDRTCRKAGLPQNAWETGEATVTLFEGAVFRERDPEGSVEALSA